MSSIDDLSKPLIEKLGSFLQSTFERHANTRMRLRTELLNRIREIEISHGLAPTIKEERVTIFSNNNIDEGGKENIDGNVGRGSSCAAEALQTSKREIKPVVKTEMPPPKLPIRRGRKAKKAADLSKVDEDVRIGNGDSRESDVILQKEHVSIINLDDGSDEEQPQPQPLRVTRSKMRAPKTNANTQNSAEVSIKKTTTNVNDETKSGKKTVKEVESKKRTRSPLQNILKSSNTTKSKKKKSSEEEDDVVKPSLDGTFVKSNAVASETFIKTPKAVIPPESPNANKTFVKKTAQPVFSPYQNSPVKSRVEAFEKLNQPKIPDEASQKQEAKSKSKLKKPVENNSQQTNTQERRDVTPQKNTRFGLASSASKLMKSIASGVLPAKNLTTSKISQQTYIERETKKKEEAINKKEQMLQAKVEESKRKREERQLKAQLQREALIKKQKEETEQKVHQLKMKERERILEMQKTLQKKEPKYLRHSPPLLPTEDCYDSDDERKTNVQHPIWATSGNKKLALMVARFTSRKIRNTLFMLKPCTPDLTEIFSNINPSKLRRNSSAVWTDAPKMSIMPIPEEEIWSSDSSF